MIFIVDDDSAVCHSLSFLLACEGLGSRTFSDARDFLADAEPSDDDWLITDVDLPGIDGIDLLRRLRAQGLKLPVIVMTGRPNSFARRRALDCGAMAFLEKPVEQAVLLDLLRSRGGPAR